MNSTFKLIVFLSVVVMRKDNACEVLWQYNKSVIQIDLPDFFW